jgi:hypothetical protein
LNQADDGAEKSEKLDDEDGADADGGVTPADAPAATPDDNASAHHDDMDKDENSVKEADKSFNIPVGDKSFEEFVA